MAATTRMTSSANATLLDNLKSPRSATSQIYSPSIRSARLSEDSDDSLRDLELSEGPLLAENPRPFRGRSYSVTGFDFQHDLLPLSASLSEPEDVHLESNEKRLGLVNGEYSAFIVLKQHLRRLDTRRHCPHRWSADRLGDFVSVMNPFLHLSFAQMVLKAPLLE